MSLFGNRFLTLNTVVRVNQIEAGRTQLIGQDESQLHSPELTEAFRDAIAQGWPGGRITWAFSWLALQDDRPQYRAIREIVNGYRHQYGDEITFIPGAFFANAYNSRAQVNRDIHDGLALVGEIAGHGYRPTSIVAGFLAADNQRYLAEVEGIHVCQGNIWSQYAIDNQDGDGSLCYPYYPSTEHFCKPAQHAGDFIDCVTLDGWTCDFLAARRTGFTGGEGFNSRMGVGPIETIGQWGPELGLQEMLATTGGHFDTGFTLNGFGWVTNCWEVSLAHPQQIGHLECLTGWLQSIRSRWPAAQLITQGEFGLRWREHNRDNTALDYRFDFQGTGIGGSDRDKRLRWYMNRDFRLALLRDLTAGQSVVIDYTRYDLSAREPRNDEQTRSWSLLGYINQKQSRAQDAPVPFSALPEEEQARILARCPEVAAVI